jgi:phosphohistidine phosphatase
MKHLSLLRHAKSAWDDPAARDFDRPLNPRGRRAARAIAERIKAEGLGFDLVLASPAGRSAETLDEVETVLGPLHARYEQRLYLASAETLLDIVHAVDDGAERLLLVGHNPGFERLALLLARKGPLRSEVEVKYPTGTLAEIALPAERWRDVAKGSGTLTRFIRPRDLDPELGPEEA